MIRTLVVVDVPFYREGLTDLLNRSGTVQVVAAADNAELAERFASSERPQVALVDVGMADCVEAIRRMAALPFPPVFVALALNETPDAVLRWAELGVAAYVSRRASLEDLLYVLEGVVHDELHCSPRMAAHIMKHVAVLASANRRDDDVIGELSPREHEVVYLLARGLPNKVIASTLAISHATAKNHVHNILEKLRLQRRSQVASLLTDSTRRHSA